MTRRTATTVADRVLINDGSGNLSEQEEQAAKTVDGDEDDKRRRCARPTRAVGGPADSGGLEAGQRSSQRRSSVGRAV